MHINPNENAGPYLYELLVNQYGPLGSLVYYGILITCLIAVIAGIMRFFWILYKEGKVKGDV